MATNNVVFPLKPQPVRTTTTTALATGTVQPYNASSATLAPTLPALSGVVDDDHLIIEKDSADVTANAVTVTCAAGDTFFSGATTSALVVPGERLHLQAATVNSARVWKVLQHTVPRGGADTRYLTYLRPEQYGAPAAYSSSVDDTAAVQAALTAAATLGGRVLLSRKYRCPNGGLTVGVGVRSIEGIGGLALAEDNSGTYTLLSGIEQASLTATALSIHTPGIDLAHFGVINTVTSSTSSVGIDIVHSPSMSGRRIDVANFWTNYQFDSTFLADFVGLHSWDPVQYGLNWKQSVNYDLGDTQFTDFHSVMWAQNYSPQAGFYIQSGGGLRLISGKINGKGGAQNPNAGLHKHGIFVEVAAGVTTADILVSGWSIENFSQYGFRARQANGTSGNIENVVLVGNQFGYGTGTTVGIQLESGISNVTINGCAFAGITTGIVHIAVNGVSIGGDNVYVNVPTPVSIAAGAAAGVHVSPIRSFTNGVLLQNANTSAHKDPLVVHEYRQSMPVTNSTSVPVILWSFGTDLYQAGEIDLVLSGSVNGIGNYLLHLRRIATRGASGAISIATPTGWTDVSIGTTTPVITFDTATTPGEVAIKAALGSQGTDVNGVARFRYDGSLMVLRQRA